MATIDWTPVEEAEAEHTVSGYKIALLEAAKLFEQRMADEKIPGRTAADHLEAVKLHLTRPADVTRAYSYVGRLRAGTTGALTKERAKAYIQAFRQAVADLNDLTQSRDSFAAQFKLALGTLKSKQFWLVRALIGLGVFFVLVLFLADTTPGQVLVAAMVGFVHLFFSWIIGLLVGIALLVFVVVGTALYLDRRGGTVRGEDEE
jgi:hypothetical protein